MIRLATSADAPAIVAMALQFIRDTGYRAIVRPNPPQLETLVAFLLEHGAIFVVDRGGVLVGMMAVTVVVHPMSGEVTGSEVAWWLQPEARGGTAAIRMLAAGEAWALERGATSFEMIAPAASTVGELYRRRGYSEVETVFRRPLAA